MLLAAAVFYVLAAKGKLTREGFARLFVMGMAVLIAEESKVIDKLDGLLTLKGLRLIWEKNHPAA